VTRQIELERDALVVRYDGLDSLLVMRREVRIPYEKLESAALGLADPPSTLSWRIGLADPITGTRRGRFWSEGTRWFLDFRHPERALTLRLRPGAEYDVVAIEVDHAESLLEAISERRP
jgi:hypothetical protein